MILATPVLVGCIFGWMAVHAQEDSATKASAVHAKKPGVRAALPEVSQVSVYDSDPAHPWNRLHSALFVRTTVTGKSYGQDELDPLLWSYSKYLLLGERHKKILAILDEFISSKSDTLIKDPLKRAVLQRDLWSIFDWLANPQEVYASRRDEVAAEPEQRRRGSFGKDYPAASFPQNRSNNCQIIMRRPWPPKPFQQTITQLTRKLRFYLPTYSNQTGRG